MSDQDKREKVIKGLERCIEKLDTVVNKTHGFNCIACPYFRKCESSGYLIGLPLMRDALALLKALELVAPARKSFLVSAPDEYGTTPYMTVCGACGAWLLTVEPRAKYCPNCGRAVKWE